MNVFDLFAKLSLDTTEYYEGLDKAESKASGFSQALKTGVGVAAGLTTAAITATAAATVAGTKAFIDGVSNVAQYSDHIDKLSQKMNMSRTSLQEWDFVMQHCGTSIESMQASIKTLSNAAETNNEAFERLGITQEDIANMSGEELFNATISALQNVESETERTYLAGKLLGRGATELGALLNKTAEETADMKQQVHDLGGVLSDEAVKSGAQFQDSLQNMQTAFNGLKNNLLSQFLPAFSTVMDGLSKIFSGDDSGLGMIDEGVNDFIEKLNKLMPKVIEIGGKIISSLLTAISKNLPKLLESGSSVISQLISGIITALPYLIESAVMIIGQIASALFDNAEPLLRSAIDLILKLAQGFIENAPVIIPAIVDLITMIVKTLTEPETLTALIKCALELVKALADGIVDALPELVAVIPEVTMNLIDAIINNFPEILETVLYLIGSLGYAILKSVGDFLGQTLWELTTRLSEMFNNANQFGQKIGAWLANGVQKVKTTISNFFTSIGNFFTNGFNTIKSKVENALNNIKSKFTSIFDNVKNTVKNAIDFIKGLFNFEWSLPKIKLPHLTVTGQLDLFAIPPQIPTVSIEWYKKAMNQPYLLNDATIFGAANGRLLGAGESGSELVIGTNKLMNMMKQAVGLNAKDITINVYGAEGQDVRLLAKEVSRELQNLINDKEKVYA